MLSASSTTPLPCQEEEKASQASGEFEVFVNGKLVHSKKVILGKRAEQDEREGPGYREVGIMSVLFLLRT